MGTYCQNHVLAIVREKAPNSNGRVTLIPTKEGSCQHLGGCVTAHDDLYKVIAKYQPTDEEIDKAKIAKEAVDKANEKIRADAKAASHKIAKEAEADAVAEKEAIEKDKAAKEKAAAESKGDGPAPSEEEP